MVVAFVKAHAVVSEKVLDTSVNVTVNAGGVAAGNLLVLGIVYDNAATVGKPTIAASSSITKQAGETASWVFLGASRHPSSTSIGAFAGAELWAIKTTVAWSAGTYTATLDTSVTQKATSLIEFSGAEVTLRSTVGSAYSTTTTAALPATTGTTPVVGDLALGFLFGSNVAAAQSGSSSSLGGTWSTAVGVGSTGGSAATNNFGVVQYKILTAAQHQTYGNATTMTAGNGSIVAILQATLPPALTQAAYRFYADGPEDASTALAAQDTAPTVDLTTLPPALVATYPSSNIDQYGGLSANTTATVESFTSGPGGPLVRAGIDLNRTGSPIGTITCHLWAHTGTYGGDGAPTGAPLATSTTVVDAASVSTAGTKYYFEFDGSVQMVAETVYCIGVVASSTLAFGNHVGVGQDVTTSTYPGNRALYQSGVWQTGAIGDTTFEVYAAADGLPLQLRLRLQETAGQPVLPTDDFQLQWANNEVLADSNPFAAADNLFGVSGAITRLAQSFLGNGGKLSRAGFSLRRNGSDAAATVTAVLYAHDGGTFGGTGLPTGAALATAAPVAFNDLPTATVPFYFDFDATVTLTSATPYTIALVTTNLSGVNSIAASYDQISSTHPGRMAQYNTGTWQVASGDLCFEVYTATSAWTNVGGSTVVPYDSANLTVLADTYPFSNGDSPQGLNSATPARAQSFSGNGGLLTSAVFALQKSNTPTGTVSAVLYAHTGTFGSGGTPTGAALATSTNSVTASTLTGSSVPTTFTFDGTVTLAAGTPYFIGLLASGAAANPNDVGMRADFTSSTHQGNSAVFNGTTWTSTTQDYTFQVYTSAVNTTNRLTGGTGTFVPGKVSEDGLVDDLGWSASNYTELLYSITLKAADLAHADTLRFRVIDSNTEPVITYTQTPTLSVSKVAGPAAATGTGTVSVTGTGAGRATAPAGTASVTVDATGTAAEYVPGVAASGTASVTVSGAGAGRAASAGTASVTVSGAGTARAPSAGTASVTVSGAVGAAGSAEYNGLGALNGPLTSTTDGNPITLANEFYVTSPVLATKVRFWRGDVTITGTPVGYLWEVLTASTGTLLASKTYPALSGVGWQVATLDTPVSLVPGKKYRVGLSTLVYSATSLFWDTGVGSAGLTNGPISMPNKTNAIGLDQGSYSSGTGVFPVNSFNSTNYWIDVTVSLTTAGVSAGSAGSGTITVSATGAARAASAGTASVTVSASGTLDAAPAPAAGTAEVTVSASGTAVEVPPVAATGTAAVTVSATGGAGVASAGTGSVTVSGSGGARTASSGTGAVSVSGAGTGLAPAAGTASLTVSGAGTGSAASPAGSGSVSVSGSGAGRTSASGAGSVVVTGTAPGALTAAGTGSVTVTGAGFADSGVTPYVDGVAFNVTSAAAPSFVVPLSVLTTDVMVLGITNADATATIAIPGATPLTGPTDTGTMQGIVFTGTGYTPGSTVTFTTYTGANPSSVVVGFYRANTVGTPTSTTKSGTVATLVAGDPSDDTIGDRIVTVFLEKSANNVAYTAPAVPGVRNRQWSPWTGSGAGLPSAWLGDYTTAGTNRTITYPQSSANGLGVQVRLAVAALTSGTADVSVSGSGTVGTTAAGTGAVTVAAAGALDGSFPAAGTASVVVSGAGSAASRTTGTGAATVTASGAGRGVAPAGTGSASATGSGTARVASAGTGTVTASGAGTAGATSPAGAAVVTVAATGAPGATSSAGTASVTVAATGALDGAFPATGTAFVTVTGTGAARTPVAGSGSVTVSAAGGARAASAGTASVTVSGAGTLPAPASGTGTVSVAASGTARAAAAGTGLVTASAAATSGPVQSSGIGTVTVNATGTAATRSAASGTATVTVSALGATSTLATAAGTASVTAAATGGARAAAAGTATVILVGSGAGRASILAGTGAVAVSATSTARARAAGAGSVTVSAVVTYIVAGVAGTGVVTVSAEGTTIKTPVVTNPVGSIRTHRTRGQVRPGPTGSLRYTTARGTIRENAAGTVRPSEVRARVNA